MLMVSAINSCTTNVLKRQSVAPDEGAAFPDFND
jgi:hypothetical protein